MLSKGPHISIEAESLVPRILRINDADFSEWPDAVKTATVSIAEELFLAMYNPYIPVEVVKKSVQDHFELFRRGLAHHYATSISEGITMFWSAHEGDEDFRQEAVARLLAVVPDEVLDTSRHARVANATDATDLRLELPLFVVTPRTPEEVAIIIRLANEMQFAIIPRGGGSGLTGGAIPARKRSVVMALTKMTRISEVDGEEQSITAEAGALTINVTNAAKHQGFFFSVDPASKAASTIGGNVAENAGGPLCFEYGTTIDNLLSWRMVTPEGDLIEVKRDNHPRHKIVPDEEAVFLVRTPQGELIREIRLKGTDIRKAGLGKDVTNKALGGLPGMQKEGTDGIITDATFIVHRPLSLARVMVLEFFGRSMENSMLVINDIVALRDTIRVNGDLVKITALEEFNTKYVQAIAYRRKSSTYEGDPISVLILQLESDDAAALENSVRHIKGICDHYDGVDGFVAKDAAEAELFWEDRHRLSAIARRTSGFKINEDVVLPLKAVPAYSRFLEGINLEYMGRAYRWALKQAGYLKGLSEDSRIVEELAYVTRIISREISAAELSDQELHLHTVMVFRALAVDYPVFAEKLENIKSRMMGSCIIVASHMHAGDGNWHVNIPVNSNDPIMLKNGEIVAHMVMAKAQELGGEVTGEHGIGVTKVAFLTDEKLYAFAEYKQLVDPRNIINPAKLTRRTMPVAPFTFSFNRLIEDIRQSGLENKERLIALLADVQICTRCGKCKQFCPMHYPEASFQYQPRNKNMVLGALIEAIYYTQVNTGQPAPELLDELRVITEYCTGCGKCASVCPVKIASGDVALALRGYLEDEHAGGHPIKARALNYIAKNPALRIPLAGKFASIGQGIQNKLLGGVPAALKKRVANPLFSGPGPKPGYMNIHESLALHKGSLFVPEGGAKGTALYFPGCGGGVFFRNVSLAGVALLLKAGYAVLLPEKHLCCGYPLLAAGEHEAFATNQDRNITHLRRLAAKAAKLGYPVDRVLTACGSCRDGMERHFIGKVLRREGETDIPIDDASRFLMEIYGERINAAQQGAEPVSLVYHTPCHAELPGVKKTASGKLFAAALAEASGANVVLSPGCCGESGLGAMTSPAIYNALRAKKEQGLEQDLAKAGDGAEVVVSCPSCKMGITRILLNRGEKRRVLHVLEFLAEQVLGKKKRRRCQKLVASTPAIDGVRHVAMDQLPSVEITKQDVKEDAEE